MNVQRSRAGRLFHIVHYYALERPNIESSTRILDCRSRTSIENCYRFTECPTTPFPLVRRWTPRRPSYAAVSRFTRTLIYPEEYPASSPAGLLHCASHSYSVSTAMTTSLTSSSASYWHLGTPAKPLFGCASCTYSGSKY